MTEDEAKTKWCPFVRLTGTDAEWHTNRAAGEQGGDSPGSKASYRCIASACMAWRATKDKTRNWHDEERELHEERHGEFVPGGYCGLAGAPS